MSLAQQGCNTLFLGWRGVAVFVLGGQSRAAESCKPQGASVTQAQKRSVAPGKAQKRGERLLSQAPPKALAGPLGGMQSPVGTIPAWCVVVPGWGTRDITWTEARPSGAIDTFSSKAAANPHRWEYDQ